MKKKTALQKATSMLRTGERAYSANTARKKLKLKKTKKEK